MISPANPLDPSSPFGSRPEASRTPETASRSESARKAPLKVLLVDDDEITLELIAGTLSAEYPIEIQTAAHGAEALERVLRGDIPLVISDWMMPGMDGVELCRRIRAADLPGYVYFIMVTARDEDGDVVESLGSGADEYITKPVTAAELNARVRSILRLRELHEEIRAQNSQLRQIRKLKDDWINMIVHDIRSPMTAILGRSDLALRNATPQQRSQLEVVKREAQRVSGMLEQMLVMARSEEGRLRLMREPADLRGIAGEAMESMNSVASAKNASLELVANGGEATIELDASLVRRLLDNLLANAVRYSPSGGRVTVNLDTTTNHVVLAVADEGPGVPPELRETIFARHETTDAGSDDGRHFGLGLAFCRMVVEAHGGTIVCEPGDPCGSRFEVRFPSTRSCFAGTA